MKITVNNKCIHVGDMKISGVGGASLVLVGDAETIATSSYFDTPASSFVYSPNIPLNPVRRNQQEES
ncbi:spore gernimation protein GerPD [Paenibacillus sp. RC67]|uniref:spore gernimation protein GerPD n=1 Tax=Paenibacillus sp. RC67 TaxID=3039392 RepID=UPI0024ACC6C7|nr:spore gernimation protein GerPD [Paenibacillus sp. RC67]